MNKLMTIILTTLAASLMLSVSQFSHVAAMPNQSGMPTSNHSTPMNSRQHCEVSHMGTVTTNEDQAKGVKKHNDKDDEPEPPYYLRLARTQSVSARQVITYTSPELSDKVPLYRLYSVVRR